MVLQAKELWASQAGVCQVESRMEVTHEFCLRAVSAWCSTVLWGAWAGACRGDYLSCSWLFGYRAFNSSSLAVQVAVVSLSEAKPDDNHVTTTGSQCWSTAAVVAIHSFERKGKRLIQHLMLPAGQKPEWLLYWGSYLPNFTAAQTVCPHKQIGSETWMYGSPQFVYSWAAGSSRLGIRKTFLSFIQGGMIKSFMLGKKSLRLSPTGDQTPPCQVDHGIECYVQLFLECLQG